MKGLVPLLGLALLLPGTAEAEVVVSGVSEGALSVARDGSSRVAWIDGRRLMLAKREGSWLPSPIATLPTTAGRVSGLAENAVLVEGRRAWIRLVVRRATGGACWSSRTHRGAHCSVSPASRSTPRADRRPRTHSRS